MYLDGFWSTNSWGKFNSQISSELGLTSLPTVRAYRGLNHALVETTQGIAQIYPTKQKIIYFKDMDPYYDLALKKLSRIGYELISYDLELLHESEEFWKDKITKEILFVLYSVDVPLIGKKFHLDSLRKSLQGEKVFRIEVSHASHFAEPPPTSLEGYEVRLNALSSQYALGLMGTRAKKLPSLVSEAMIWPTLEMERNEVPEFAAGKLNTGSSFRSEILEFEAHPVADFRPLFSPEQDRIWDRSLIYWEDMDAHALIHKLSEELELPLGELGSVENRLETPSLTRWGGFKTMDWLKNVGLSEKQIRGLVIIDGSLLGPKFTEKLILAREDIVRRQGPSMVEP